MTVGQMTWFPWASKRNIYESSVNLITELRDHVDLILHVKNVDKDFAVMVAKHGVIRRVGTLYGILDEPISVFQSRKDKRKD